MYNLNVNVSAAGTAVNNLLAVESACTTPRTPEILNSLIAMTNPLDNYSFGNETTPKLGSCLQNINNDSNSSCSTQGENSTSPPSIQHTCSQLIKAGLKLSIESKRKHSADNDDFLDLDLNAKRVRKSECDDDDGDRSLSPTQGLTPEDEERRRRRRERNKIAATKCRLKKREKTVNLVHESEILETQNIDLKTQIQELESQRRRLVDMLTLHTPSCMKHHNNSSEHFNQSRDGRFIVPDEDNQNYSPDGPLPPVTSLSTSVIESSHVYNRPASVDIGPTFRSQNLEFCSRPASVGISENNFPAARTNNVQYAKPPTIIIEGESYSPPSQLTNLDNSGISYHYNTQQCHNYNSPNSTNQNYSSSTMDNGCMA